MTINFTAKYITTLICGDLGKLMTTESHFMLKYACCYPKGGLIQIVTLIF
ncbi:hypothetical protein Dfer_2340 [Dyadobacter fermentans DSM 18053]|uniref:Uncharacterized protein n=1 Tax=Dyadobacter fermentans (strain ATCC 700827 / DSM 18053 / CIP 107007 / KCTC 52180 / NS114) TaxID=471854 RepID=C6VZT1_DYAFD|nr:hypothetical protein Dfer_2340 [Dyadobacter fermentans DSM 18053]